jgi:hypothetical protein
MDLSSLSQQIVDGAFSRSVPSGNVFKDVIDWLFSREDTLLVPSHIKKDSRITNTYLIRLFLRNGEFNYFLNGCFNHFGTSLWGLDKQDLLVFLKHCILKLNLTRNSVYYTKKGRKTKDIIEKIESKFSLLKSYECECLETCFEPTMLEAILLGGATKKQSSSRKKDLPSPSPSPSLLPEERKKEDLPSSLDSSLPSFPPPSSPSFDSSGSKEEQEKKSESFLSLYSFISESFEIVSL